MSATETYTIPTAYVSPASLEFGPDELFRLSFDTPSYDIDPNVPFLAFEGEGRGRDPRSVNNLADLLILHRIPLVVLNACQSGKQTGVTETSLAAGLMKSGVKMVVAMRWSITVTAAQKFITKLYSTLFDGYSAEDAITYARLALADSKERRAVLNETITLEHWLVPVVHCNEQPKFLLRGMTDEEEVIWLTKQAMRARMPIFQFGYYGRDSDIFAVERKLICKNNILLITGVGGSGKTSFLKDLCYWGESTELVKQSFFFSWADETWNRSKIVRSIIQSCSLDRLSMFDSLPTDEVKQQMAVDILRSNRYFLMFDEFESIKAERIENQRGLTAEQRQDLKRFLESLKSGRSLVVIASRRSENWCAIGTFEDNVHNLKGLDYEASFDFADEILQSHGVRHRRLEPAFADLLRLLGGHVLAMQMALPNLVVFHVKNSIMSF